jgi:hypothetical protein
MICKLLELTQITHELNEMNKNEVLTVPCYLLADRCNNLKIYIGYIPDASLRNSDREMTLEIYTLCKKLEDFFWRRLSRAKAKETI